MSIPAEGDIVDVLRHQHEELKQTMTEVETSTGLARAEAFGRVIALLETHERSEQRVVHPTTRETPGGAEIAEERVAEEEEADEVLAELRELGTDDPDFPARFTVFRESVIEHAQHEEDEEFPVLRATLPADQLLGMADELRAVQART
ncbi:hemerythrin domain-containing protein [Luedemannella helvata]|uniref:Hemerythrin domain-containing protein n=1 Tax=Luedemannella helvata TaxID=349315 RepID=A0ABN2K392_9ACTN